MSSEKDEFMASYGDAYHVKAAVDKDPDLYGVAVASGNHPVHVMDSIRSTDPRAFDHATAKYSGHPEHHDELVHHEDPRIRVALAGNYRISKEHHSKLAKDPDPIVRGTLARNTKSVEYGTAEKLLDDSSNTVAGNAADSLTIHADFRKHAEKFKDHPNPEVAAKMIPMLSAVEKKKHVDALIDKDDEYSRKVLSSIKQPSLAIGHTAMTKMAEKGHKEYLTSAMLDYRTLPSVYAIYAQHPDPNISSVGKTMSGH